MEAVSSRGTKRRTLLQRGLALVGGALGLQALGRQARAEDVMASEPGPVTLKFYARRWPAQPHSPLNGQASSGDRVVSYGELLDGPQGNPVGELYSNGFCLETPFGPHFLAASNIEFQTFKLRDGTLFGIGAAGGAVAGERTYAILGGTGRFAGARGSYVERTVSSGPADHGAVEMDLILTA